LQLPAGAADTESYLQFQKRPSFFASIAATPVAITVTAMATSAERQNGNVVSQNDVSDDSAETISKRLLAETTFHTPWWKQ
jgi:hypothetical protein